MSARITLAVLALAVFLSALVVIQTKHENRALVHELEQLRAEKEQLEVEWSQLQLEEATLAGHGRVELFAHDRLNMLEPPQYLIVSDSP